MELPFRAEYAKSGRSNCKGCRTAISKETLRLAVLVQSPMFDGKVPHWYHFSCFFTKQRIKTVGDISHFESLRWEDQEQIRGKIEGGSTSSSNSGIAVNGSNDGKKSKKTVKRKINAPLEFSIEYSISSRATCRGCEEKIIKGDIRASKKDFESDEGRRYGGIALWHHLECFVKLRHDLEFWESGSNLPGFEKLKNEDKDKVKTILPEIKPIKVKKEESDMVDGAESAKKPKVENMDIIKKQNKRIYRYRDLLKALKKNEKILLFEHNDQEIPIGQDLMLDRLSDIMVFGALLPCKECKTGQLVFRSGVGYFCLGNKTEWVKCETVTLNPERKPFSVPEELKERYEFLNSYKYKPQKRAFQGNAPSKPLESVASTSYALKSMVKSEPSSSGPKIDRYLPLKNMEFVIMEKLSVDKEKLKLQIMKLGGKLTSKIHPKTTAVISTKERLEGSSKLLSTAKQYEIQVVPVEFIEACEQPGANAVLNINKMNLVSWGADPTNRMVFATSDSKSKSKNVSGKFKSNLPSKVKLKVKHGVAVDPDSGLEDFAHIYRFNKDIYDTTLSLTDLQTGRNSYYKLQVLESNDGKKYWLFRSWGRIGTTIGGTKLEAKKSREEAIDEFKGLFEEKTGNMWSNRKNFTKIPQKMIMVDICYDDSELPNRETDVPSKLEKPVQNLISLIFNVDTMKNVMMEFELDLEKMPLGKLSKKQIHEAFKVLTMLQNFILSSGSQSDVQTILGCTNQFYTLIPHDFGVENPPLLNNLEVIKQKTEMLDALMELEIAYSLLNDIGSGDRSLNYIDSYYMQLQADITVLNKSSSEFKTLELYIQNTHAETHRNYELEIVEIFKVKRSVENKRFKPFMKMSNRKLLWHGSRLTNFAGIISQGLRIAPPVAPVTGYMFGKGVYFADMVSKSANYCMTNATNNTGLVLLCQVALGEMYERTRAEAFEKPPKGKNSVKGIGMTEPDPKDTIIREDGVQIPLGKGIRHEDKNTSLLYNEYIVYDIAQVKVEYLVQLKFHYK